MSTPNLSSLRRELPKWTAWLKERGAELLTPTNQWEVLRFRGSRGTSVVYKNARDKLSFTGESVQAWEAFVNAKPWRAVDATKRGRNADTRAVRARDGDRCFFCGLLVCEAEESVDHLVPVTAGGPNHVSNKVLMHRACNSYCGPLSAPEKIRAHVEWQLAAVLR